MRVKTNAEDTGARGPWLPQKSRSQHDCRGDRSEASPVLTITTPMQASLHRELLPLGMSQELSVPALSWSSNAGLLQGVPVS
jgi:hypothetical protein